MWKPQVHFISLHYLYVIALSFLGFTVIGAYGNLAAIDAYFLATSAATVSGLTTVNVDRLKVYQQLCLYFVPLVANMVFINMIVVIVRLYMFERRIREFAPRVLWLSRLSTPWSGPQENVEARTTEQRNTIEWNLDAKPDKDVQEAAHRRHSDNTGTGGNETDEGDQPQRPDGPARQASQEGTARVTFTDDVRPPKPRALYIPPPRERDSGHPLVEVEEKSDDGSVRSVARATDADFATSELIRPRKRGTTSRTIERVASSIFVPAGPPSQPRETGGRRLIPLAENLGLPFISPHASVGRNSQFHNLTAQDRERLGGIEYRSLKLLLKVIFAYYLCMHLLGAIGLNAWILHSDPKYRRGLADIAQNKTWWAFFSSQTMASNLGFTLTPNSMIPFQDAVFPMLWMTALGYVGNTFYPCMLRLVIWILFKTIPQDSSLHEPLNYLLKHPRRCYTLLFPSTQTWVLFTILVILNVVDVILFIVLDLNIHAVSKLPPGIRLAAALFQVTSSRHTGTSSFNLADVHPAIQFSLLVMMYISVFPVALSVRASNTYEERALGIFSNKEEVENKPGRSYFVAHIKNQLAFDLWYIFLGAFCICISEGNRIMDPAEPHFTLFAIFFEVASAYGNVGLSLGYPTVDTGFSGVFNTFSKTVICLLMLRGRHRGMPSRIDRAIMLPGDLVINEHLLEEPADKPRFPDRDLSKMKRYHTS